MWIRIPFSGPATPLCCQLASYHPCLSLSPVRKSNPRAAPHLGHGVRGHLDSSSEERSLHHIRSLFGGRASHGGLELPPFPWTHARLRHKRVSPFPALAAMFGRPRSAPRLFVVMPRASPRAAAYGAVQHARGRTAFAGSASSRPKCRRRSKGAQPSLG